MNGYLSEVCGRSHQLFQDSIPPSIKSKNLIPNNAFPGSWNLREGLCR